MAFNKSKKTSKRRALLEHWQLIGIAIALFDAVAVSTPDHSHFHPSWIGMQLNKHLYLEKPMAHCVKECRILTELAREKKLATQLGMQRHAMPSMRRTFSGVVRPASRLASLMVHLARNRMLIMDMTNSS